MNIFFSFLILIAAFYVLFKSAEFVVEGAVGIATDLGIPKMIIEVDSPGICNPDARKFSYSKLSRPIYPLDEFEWEGPGQARLASAARSPSRV